MAVNITCIWRPGPQTPPVEPGRLRHSPIGANGVARSYTQRAIMLYWGSGDASWVTASIYIFIGPRRQYIRCMIVKGQV